MSKHIAPLPIGTRVAVPSEYVAHPGRFVFHRLEIVSYYVSGLGRVPFPAAGLWLEEAPTRVYANLSNGWQWPAVSLVERAEMCAELDAMEAGVLADLDSLPLTV